MLHHEGIFSHVCLRLLGAQEADKSQITTLRAATAIDGTSREEPSWTVEEKNGQRPMTPAREIGQPRTPAEIESRSRRFVSGFDSEDRKNLAPIWHQNSGKSKKLSVPDGI